MTAPQWTVVLWARLEEMVEEMAVCCTKVCDFILKPNKRTHILAVVGKLSAPNPNSLRLDAEICVHVFQYLV